MVDGDDDDENDVIDSEQTSAIPEDDLHALSVDAPAGARITTSGPVRLVIDGEPVATPFTLPAARVPLKLALQGVRASTRPDDASVSVEVRNARVEMLLTCVTVRFLRGSHRPLEPSREALSVSHAVSNDESLARGTAYRRESSDPDDFRIEVLDPRAHGLEITAAVASRDASGAPRGGLPDVLLTRPVEGLPFRSRWLRLVGDRVDLAAPGVEGQVLEVALRDVVDISYQGLRQSARVGRPGDESGPNAARRAALRIRVLRVQPGGAPVVGKSDAAAVELARYQITIANQVWLQCAVSFGDPETADVAVVDPPPASLLSVSDRDGLPAAGGGEIHFRAGERAIGPVRTTQGAPPFETALQIADALERAGLRAQVTENPRTEFGAQGSADVVVRNAAGTLLDLAPVDATQLSTDARQQLSIGRVRLGDGLGEFDNMTASAGTLEERTLLKTLMDDDPTTIDLLIVNSFRSGTRQGEAFIQADNGAISNAVILDRTGVRMQRRAWTQSHEIGHVFLNMPFHPDNVGPDRPWLLMDADSNEGTVTGPKRISENECLRMRAHSGVGTPVPLLAPLGPRTR